MSEPPKLIEWPPETVAMMQAVRHVVTAYRPLVSDHTIGPALAWLAGGVMASAHLETDMSEALSVLEVNAEHGWSHRRAELKSEGYL